MTIGAGERVALVGVVQRQRADAVGDVGEDEWHAEFMPRRWSSRPLAGASSLERRMLDHVFTDAISALRDAFEAAFLERQAFEEHFQVDVLLGDITWETSYGLPGEGQPPRVVAHVTFDWPTWSQTAYRRWYVDEELESAAGDRDGDRAAHPAPRRAAARPSRCTPRCPSRAR